MESAPPETARLELQLRGLVYARALLLARGAAPGVIRLQDEEILRLRRLLAVRARSA